MHKSLLFGLFAVAMVSGSVAYGMHFTRVTDRLTFNNVMGTLGAFAASHYFNYDTGFIKMFPVNRQSTVSTVLGFAKWGAGLACAMKVVQVLQNQLNVSASRPENNVMNINGKQKDRTPTVHDWIYDSPFPSLLITLAGLTICNKYFGK